MADKHVRASGIDRSEAISVEVTAGLKGSRPIPVVVTTHEYAIKLYHWSDAIGFWRGQEIIHQRLPRPLPYDSPRDSQIEFLSQLGWCHRVGLTAGDGNVFIAYKRSLAAEAPRIYLDVYRTPDDGYSLNLVNRIELPLPGVRAGYYLWLGFDLDRDRLLLLAQVYIVGSSEPQLMLMTSTEYDDPLELEDLLNWEVLDLGAGGWDLDARIDDALHIVHREHAYAASFTFDQTETELAATDAVYQPLRYTVVRLSDRTITDNSNSIPRGEHPQLIAGDPPAIVFDRLSQGSMIYFESYPAPGGDFLPDGIQYMFPSLERSRKYLAIRIASGWIEMPLMEIDETRIERTHVLEWDSWTLSDPVLFAPQGQDRQLYYARPLNRLPVHGVHLAWSDDDGLLAFLVHHRADIDALVLTRIEHQPISLQVESPNLDRYAVLDIQHQQIPDHFTLEPVTWVENRAFWRFELERLLLTNTDLPAFWGRPALSVNNAIGRNLVMQTSPNLLLAWIHAGDGGVRTLFDVDLPWQAPIQQGPESLDADAVVGFEDAQWRAITTGTAGGWLDYQIEPHTYFYLQQATRFCGLDRTIHPIFLGAIAALPDSLSDNGRELTLADADVAALGGESQWESIWAVRNSINEQIQASTSLVNDIGDLTIRYSKYDVSWMVDANNEPEQVVIRVVDSYRTRFRFHGSDRGQGAIQVEIPVVVELPSVRINDFAGLATFAMVLELGYQRRFTPAILSRDIRSEDDGSSDQLDQGNGFRTCSLTAKPIGNTTMTITRNEPNFEWTAGGQVLIVVIAVLVPVLTGLGLGALAQTLTGLLASIVAAASSIIGLIVALVLLGVIIGVLEGVVPGEIERRIREEIENQNFKQLLDDAGLFLNAGEGVAEEIAFRVLDEDERESSGLNRLRVGTWHTIFVREDECLVLREMEEE